MQSPRLTSRQWFWSLTFVAFLWAYFGTRTAPANDRSRTFMQDTQSKFNWPVETALAPGTFIASKVESGMVWIAQGLTPSHKQARSNEQLEREVEALRSELRVERGNVLDLRRDLANYKAIPDGNVTLLGANIIGYGSGTGTSLIKIDRGSAEHLQVGMAVLADNKVIVGRIIDVGTTATVRLLTDPRSKVQARIVGRGNNVPLVKDPRTGDLKPCLVEGLGNGQLVCNNVEKTDISPRIDKGDIVELVDPDWPPQLRFYTIGEVDELRSSDNVFRYSIRIIPSANINTLQSVSVVIPR